MFLFNDLFTYLKDTITEREGERDTSPVSLFFLSPWLQWSELDQTKEVAVKTDKGHDGIWELVVLLCILIEIRTAQVYVFAEIHWTIPWIFVSIIVCKFDFMIKQSPQLKPV